MKDERLMATEGTGEPMPERGERAESAPVSESQQAFAVLVGKRLAELWDIEIARSVGELDSKST